MQTYYTFLLDVLGLKCQKSIACLATSIQVPLKKRHSIPLCLSACYTECNTLNVICGFRRLSVTKCRLFLCPYPSNGSKEKKSGAIVIHKRRDRAGSIPDSKCFLTGYSDKEYTSYKGQLMKQILLLPLWRFLKSSINTIFLAIPKHSTIVEYKAWLATSDVPSNTNCFWLIISYLIRLCVVTTLGSVCLRQPRTIYLDSSTR
jgi:hypothetical protein